MINANIDNSTNIALLIQGVLISPYPDQEGNKLQRQILMFTYSIWRGKQWQTTPKNLSRMQRTRAIPVA